MRLPENGRFFVGGIAPSTGDADLRSHFRRFGDVSDICLPKDHITGRPRRFAFVQFTRPGDAARALAVSRHVINGRQVYIGRAEPRQPIGKVVPLCQRIYRSENKCYRVGDVIRITYGPMSDGYEQNECVNKLRKFGVIINKTLIFYCIIGHISEDGNECLVRWPPVQRDDKSGFLGGVPVYDCRLKYKYARSLQGRIIPSYDCPLGDLAKIVSGRSLGESCANSPEDARSHNWCWLVL